MAVAHGAARAALGRADGPARTSPARRCSWQWARSSRARLPDLDDLLGRARAARHARARGGVGAAADVATYDPRLVPAAREGGRPVGMAMTEKQGGSDVRANTTHARPLNGGGPGAEYELTGHKWFCSAPMCDAFLVLAQAPGGLSCFLVPRWLPDGTRNAVPPPAAEGQARQPVERLERGRVRTARWAHGWSARRAAACRRSSRWSTTPGSTACSARPPAMRQALAQATAPRRAPRRVRQAAGRPAADAERARRPRVESEAATVTAMRLARAFDDAATATSASRSSAPRDRRRASTGSASAARRTRRSAGVPRRQRLRRGVGPAAAVPRGPLNSIWEGSGNVICLDVLRALAASPQALEAFLAELERAPAPTRGSTPYVGGDEGPSCRDLDGHRAAGPAGGRADGARAPGLAARAPRPPGGRRRVLRLAPRRRLGPRVRHAAARASTSARSSSATASRFHGTRCSFNPSVGGTRLGRVGLREIAAAAGARP